MSNENVRKAKAKPAFEIACRHEVKCELERVEMLEEDRVMAAIQVARHPQQQFR